MKKNNQKTAYINDFQIKCQKQLISRLVSKNLKGGIIGCPPPIFDRSRSTC